MSKKRLISFDNDTKISNNFTFEEDTSGRNEHSFVLSREQDVTQILKDNKEQLNKELELKKGFLNYQIILLKLLGLELSLEHEIVLKYLKKLMIISLLQAVIMVQE